MSKPGLIYRIQQQAFDETADIQTIVDISDMDNLIPDDDEPEIITLEPNGNPISVSVVDTDENPFTVIKAQQAIVRFNSTQNVGMSNFVKGSDQRWLVHAYIGSIAKTVFKGFLVRDGLNEDFMPPPNIVQLTATDNIALLRNIPLTDFDGNTPTMENKLIKLLAMAMSKTGLDLPFRIAFNIKMDGMTSDLRIPNTDAEHFFDNIYVDAKTFEDEIGTCEDCYSVVEKILKWCAFIFQRNGCWWIVRVDEIEHATRGLYVSSFTTNGDFIGNLGEKDFLKVINKDLAIWFSQGATKVGCDWPHKSSRLDYNYAMPKEVPCNIDFARGDLNTTVSPTEKLYNLDCWTLRRGVPGGYNTPITITANIRRMFNSDDYEIDRCIVITPQTGHVGFSSTDDEYIESEAIPLQVKDKFSASITWKLANNIGSSSASPRLFRMILKGNDSTWWILGEDTIGDGIHKWFQVTWTGIPVNTGKGATAIVFGVQDETEWQTISWTAPPAPVSGKLYIWIQQFYQSSTTGVNTNVYYNDLTFTYIPFINGSYRKYNGQYQKASQAGNYKAKIEEEVFLSDSPKLLFKGALQRISAYETVFSGSVAFSSTGSFTISGNHTAEYYPGQTILISGTSNNNQTFKVTAVSYSNLLSVTVVGVDGSTVAEVAGATTIQTPVFSLASKFYNAALFPAGPPDNTYVQRYGYLQVYDVWNQNKNEMRIFQATVQGLDLEEQDGDDNPNNVHLVHKYQLTDPSPHTNNKFFRLLTYNQDWRMSDMTGTLREAVDVSIDKDYSNHEFKYKD